MASSPALGALAADVLWCLGLGLLLGMLRDAAGLLLGNGPAAGFVWDVMAFVLAAVSLYGFAAGASATGLARWYMAAAMGVGALAWRRAFSGSVYAVCHAAFRALARPFCRIAGIPGQLARKLGHRIVTSISTLHLKKAKKDEKKAKEAKKQLQTPRRILYN